MIMNIQGDKQARPISYKINGECWECTSHKTSDGYPTCKRGRISRLVFKTFVGEIPDGQCVCHTCDNRLCINPSHLWLGTRADNFQDMWNKNRHAKLSGERNPRAKLTADQVKSIRNDRRRLIDIAAEYGMSNQMISRIRRGEAWRAL